MKLKPVQTYPAAELKGRVPGELHQALEAYAAYYCETTRQAIEVWPLVVLMLQQFMRGRGAGRKRGMLGQDKEVPHTVQK